MGIPICSLEQEIIYHSIISQKTVQSYHNTYQEMKHNSLLLTSKYDRLEYYSFLAAEDQADLVQCASNLKVLMSAANNALFNQQLNYSTYFKNIPVR